MKARFFVALNAQGEPVSQRTSARGVTYRSADECGSYSKSPPSSARPLRVIEVARALEWISTATLGGELVEVRGKSGQTGAVVARISTTWSDGVTKTADYWRYSTEAQVARHVELGCSADRASRLVELAPVTRTLKHWPQDPVAAVQS